MALAASFTQLDITVIQVAHLADRGIANLEDQAYFTRRQAHLSIVAFFGQQLRCSASGARQLTTFIFLQLNIVDQGANRDIRDWHAVAGADIGSRASNHNIANLKTQGDHNVALHAISVMKQRQTSCADRIVFNCSHGSGDIAFKALKIHDTYILAASTATMADSYSARKIATAITFSHHH